MDIYPWTQAEPLSHNNTKGWIEDDHMLSTGAVESGARAFRMAGLGLKDVDTAQIYDCFTYMMLTQLEDYGLCKKGEGGEFVRSGALRFDDTLPTNTSGGQLSEAHVEGMLQIVEGARQLQGIWTGRSLTRSTRWSAVTAAIKSAIRL